jgi:hypothetical protein
MPSSRRSVSRRRQDSGLHDDVERRGGLVGQEERRPRGERHGDVDPLAHPSAELVRVGRRAPGGVADLPRAPSSRSRGVRAARRRAFACAWTTWAIGVADAQDGLSAVSGSWKTMAMLDLGGLHLAVR